VLWGGISVPFQRPRLCSRLTSEETLKGHNRAMEEWRNDEIWSGSLPLQIPAKNLGESGAGPIVC